MKYKHTVGSKTAVIDVLETEKAPVLVNLDGGNFIQEKQ